MLVKMIASTGVAAIGVHGRSKNQPSKSPVHVDVIRAIAKAVDIPVIANGGSLDITEWQDINKFKEASGCSSVMVARAAQWNTSVFRREGLLPALEVAKEYLKLAVRYDNHEPNTKFCLVQLLSDQLETPLGRCLLSANDNKEMCELWKLEGYLKECQDLKADAVSKLSQDVKEALGYHSFGADVSGAKRRKIDPEVTEEGVMVLTVRYNRKEYDNVTPKSILNEYSVKQDVPHPVYTIREHYRDRTFKAVVSLGETQYSSSIWQGSKKAAEQAAAEVALYVLGIHPKY